MSKLLQKGIFNLRVRCIFPLASYLRKLWLLTQGMKIGKQVSIAPIRVTWPHQIMLKNNCILEHSVYFKYSSYWKKGPSIILGERVFVGNNCEFNISKYIEIGDDTNIAAGCKFIDHDHGIKLGELIGGQECKEDPIKIGNGVWLGFNVIVLKGVTIGDGAVVAAGAVVTKSIANNEIWGGVPAKKISDRKLH